MTDTLNSDPMPFTRFLRDKQKEHDHDIYRDYALMIKLAGQYERDLLAELDLPYDWAGWRPRMRWQVWGWTSEHHTHCVDGCFSYIGTYENGCAAAALAIAEAENKEWGSPFRNLFRVPIEYEMVKAKYSA